MLLLNTQVDQLVLEEVVRERFPKLGMFSNDVTIFVFAMFNYMLKKITHMFVTIA
jgi:hypothetical protein